MIAAWKAPLTQWRSVTLEQLDDSAALQTRMDRKYIVDECTLATALAGVTPGSVLEVGGEREQHYASTYFDTPDLSSYYAAARRRPRRFKVRTRSYLDADRHAIEVKLRGGSGATIKHRAWLGEDGPVDPGFLDATARRFLADFPSVADVLDELAPVLATSYRRTTLVTPNGRVTIDSDVTARVTDGEITFGPALIVETKSVRHAGEVDRALWSLGVRPSRVSKYGTSMAALNADLPSNRWARTLRRHLDTSPAAAYAA